MEDSFPPAEASYSLPYLIWNLSLSLDASLLNMNFDTVAWEYSSSAALIRCCAPICLVGQVLLNANEAYYDLSLSYILTLLWNNVELSHWSWLPESYFHRIYSCLNPASHFCSLFPHSLVANSHGEKRDHYTGNYPRLEISNVQFLETC